MKDLIKTENLIFEKYDKNNRDHLTSTKILLNDSLMNAFFKEWYDITLKSLDDNTKTFYSYMVILDNIIIGVTTITFINDETVVFSMGLLPEYRGFEYGSIIRSEMREYLFSIGIKEIKGYVKKDNLRSINNIKKNGGILKDTTADDLYEVFYHSKK